MRRGDSPSSRSLPTNTPSRSPKRRTRRSTTPASPSSPTRTAPYLLKMSPAIQTIARVTARSSSSLVRAGTTADVYSINAAQQSRTAVLGGGGALNSAYSAIASVPGAYVPANQNGYLQAVHVRGGDASEVGYEFDGIPVNRAFDNYPSSSLSSLGQLELQVYTGATPSNAEAQGLAGFVNQVIKTGTYPGYATANLSAGTPTFYHSAKRRVRRIDARPDVLLLRRHRRIQSGLSVRRPVRRCRLTPTSSASSSARAPARRHSPRPTFPRASPMARRTSGRTELRDGSSGRSASARSTPPTSRRAARS